MKRFFSYFDKVINPPHPYYRHLLPPTGRRKKCAFTLAEGATHVDIPTCQRKIAFTLAEVLITLGIIGVVAAMTMPSLIANHKKNVTIANLQRTYNIFSNTLVRAQVDYGDPSNWEFTGVGVEYDGSEESSNKLYDSVIIAVQKYIIPYLASGYRFENRTKTLKDLGYNSPILYRAGSNAASLTTKLPLLILNDGTWVFISRHIFGGNTNPDGTVNPMKNYGLRLLVDINGPKPPNIMGKDGFIMTMYFTKNASITFYEKVAYRPSTAEIIIKDITRDEMLDNCETKGEYCGALIQQDGWQIKYKY